MDIVRKIPEDMEELRYEYESKVPREGTCGPTLIAFLTGMSVRESILNWSIPYRGYCSFNELEKEIQKYGFDTQELTAGVKDNYVLPEGINIAIARILWRRKYSNWAIEEKNTHFVYIESFNGQLQLFDNAVGWFEPEWPVANDYMKKGGITGFIAMS